jgi:hypothetical protein
MRHHRAVCSFALVTCLAAGLATVLPAQAGTPAAGAIGGPEPATEPHACRAPFAEQEPIMDPAAVSALAERCEDPAIAALLHHRAEHAEQLRRLELMSRLLRPGHTNTDQTRLTQCRLYTALAEAFAERMQREHPAALPAALAQLNLAYEQAIYIAERTIRGHERIVGLPSSPR